MSNLHPVFSTILAAHGMPQQHHPAVGRRSFATKAEADAYESGWYQWPVEPPLALSAESDARWLGFCDHEEQAMRRAENRAEARREAAEAQERREFW